MALAFQRGEETGFNYFFNLLYEKLVYYAYRMLKDKDDAEDVVEASFIKIWEKRETIDTNNPKVIASYIYTSVRNRCLNKIKSDKLIYQDKIALDRYVSKDIHEPVIDAMIRAETIDFVYKAIKVLPGNCRKIMTLMFVDGLSYSEVAEKLNLSLSTVKNQRARAYHKIRKMIQTGILKTHECVVRRGSTKCETEDYFNQRQSIYDQIISNCLAGKPQNAIAKQLSVSQSLVSLVFNRYKRSLV